MGPPPKSRQPDRRTYLLSQLSSLGSASKAPVWALTRIPVNSQRHSLRQPSAQCARWGKAVLKILIVEDETQLSSMLKYMIEDNPRFRVVGIADDASGALAAAAATEPDLALIDLHLANGSSGYGVAARLSDDGIPCLFVTGRAPGFAMPDLALGCLMKPFTSDDVHQALAMAEDVMRGRKSLRPRTPKNFELYDAASTEAQKPAQMLPPPRLSLTGRLAAWVAGSAH